VSNNKKLLTTLNYEVWREHFFRLRIALTCKISMLYFGISGLFYWLYTASDRSGDIWSVRRDCLLLLLSGVGLLLTRFARKNNHLNLIFICLSVLLIFALNVETSAKGITLNNEFSDEIFLILAVLIPVKFRLHIIAQVINISAYFMLEYLVNPHGANTFLSQASVIFMELLDILQLCVTSDIAIFLQEKLKRSELKSRRELQLFVQNLAQELRQPLMANLASLREAIDYSQDLVAIARSSLTNMLRSSDRQLILIQMMLDRARVNKLQSTDPSQTDYQLWRSRFIHQRLPWFLGIYLIFFVGLLAISIYVVIFEAKSAEQRALFFAYCFLSALMIVCLATCYRLSKLKLSEFHFICLFVGVILILCLGFQAFDLVTGYFKLSVRSEVFLLAAILLPVSWRIHLMAQIAPVIGYGGIVALLTALSIDIPMTTAEIFEEILLFLIVCLVCNVTVYTLDRLRKTEYESRRQMKLFLYAIAHDLKTPVLGMSMFLENLLIQPQTTFEFSRSKVQRLLQASDRELSLLDGLLEVHQTESQGIICNCQPIELNSLIEPLKEAIEAILLKNEANLTSLIPECLPLINADSIQLGRVYENLIINAIKHNPPGIKILLKAKLQKNCLYCTVEDNGLGIDPAIHERIFSLYGGESVRRTPGLGLGLYLCRQIIQAHQGEIGVNSSLGMGATFWFTLPIKQVASPKGYRFAYSK
jgi:signal transduction histidine kinase